MKEVFIIEITIDDIYETSPSKAFKSFRRASEFLINRGYEPYAEESIILEDRYNVYFYCEDGISVYDATILKYEVVE